LTHSKSRFDRKVDLTQLRVDLTEGSFRKKGRFHSRVDLTYARVIPRWRAKTKLIGAKWPMCCSKAAPLCGAKTNPYVRVILVCGAILENDGSVTARGRANLAFLHT
jgi:hypothetical protein